MAVGARPPRGLPILLRDTDRPPAPQHTLRWGEGGDGAGGRVRGREGRECWGMYRLGGAATVRLSAQRTEGGGETILLRGAVAGFWGVTRPRAMVNVRMPWFLMTPHVRSAQPFEWLRAFRSVRSIAASCHGLENFVLDENEAMVRWVEALGFAVDPAQRMGLGGSFFRRFWMRGGL